MPLGDYNAPMDEARWRRKYEKQQQGVRTLMRWYGDVLKCLVTPGLLLLGVGQGFADGALAGLFYLAILVPVAWVCWLVGTRLARWGRQSPEAMDEVVARGMRRGARIRRWLGLKPFDAGTSGEEMR